MNNLELKAQACGEVKRNEPKDQWTRIRRFSDPKRIPKNRPLIHLYEIGSIINETSQSLEKGRRTFSTVEVVIFPCIFFVLSNGFCIQQGLERCVLKASYCCYGVVCADILRHGVELQAHLSSQGDALVLVLPWCEYEETALGTGLIVLMPRP